MKLLKSDEKYCSNCKHRPVEGPPCVNNINSECEGHSVEFEYRYWEAKPGDGKSCDTCGNYDKPACTVQDGVGCCRKETWRSWVPIGSDTLIREIPKAKIDDGNPFNTQVGGTHYKKAVGCPDVAEWCGLQEVPFLEGNVIKYTFRHERKNGMEDLRKAQQYLKFIAWVKYKEIL